MTVVLDETAADGFLQRLSSALGGEYILLRLVKYHMLTMVARS